jgi:hypothetical protein
MREHLFDPTRFGACTVKCDALPARAHQYETFSLGERAGSGSSAAAQQPSRRIDDDLENKHVGLDEAHLAYGRTSSISVQSHCPKARS